MVTLLQKHKWAFIIQPSSASLTTNPCFFFFCSVFFFTPHLLLSSLSIQTALFSPRYASLTTFQGGWELQQQLQRTSCVMEASYFISHRREISVELNILLHVLWRLKSCSDFWNQISDWHVYQTFCPPRHHQQGLNTVSTALELQQRIITNSWRYSSWGWGQGCMTKQMWFLPFSWKMMWKGFVFRQLVIAQFKAMWGSQSCLCTVQIA